MMRLMFELNRRYERYYVMQQIPGVQAQRSVSCAQDDIGGLVLMLVQHNAHDYANVFDANASEMWMEVDDADGTNNTRLCTISPIRIFYAYRSPVSDVYAYRYLGHVDFARREKIYGRQYNIFSLDSNARCSDLPRLADIAHDAHASTPETTPALVPPRRLGWALEESRQCDWCLKRVHVSEYDAHRTACLHQR
jgi:hypothetical protein